MAAWLSSKRGVTIATLVVAFAFLFAVNAFSNAVFRGPGADFTRDKVFTFSEGTLKTLRDMEEPVTLRLFISRRLAEVAPSYGGYATRVRNLLERYASLSRGKLKLEIYSPAPYSDDEDRAVAFGVLAVPVDQSGGEQVFFGLVGTNTVDETDKIAFFHPSREPFIEYDITRLIRNLATPKKKVVGLITPLPLQGSFTPAGVQPPWAIYSEISGVFDVRNFGADTDKIPDDVDVLLIVHPLGVEDKLYYAVDQFVMRGGKVLLLLDPIPEAAPRRRTMFGPAPMPPGSEFDKLLAPWGLELVKDRVASDILLALRVNAVDQGRQIVADYIAWLDIRPTGEFVEGEGKAAKRTAFAPINPTDRVTSGLARLIMASPGIIRKTTDGTTTVTPLVTTSPRAQALDAEKLKFEPSVVRLLREYKAGDAPLVLAARVGGKVKSAFPDGPPKEKEEPKKDEKKELTAEEKEKAEKEAAEKEKKRKELEGAHLKESKGDVDLIVIADIDFLQDQFWSREQAVGNESVRVPTASNADFVMIALDQLSGQNALIGLRGKGISTRPFVLVDDLQKRATERLRAKQAELAARYKEIEEKLKDVRTRGKDGKVELTAEQQKAVLEFTTELLRIRREQREVQRGLREGVERLDARLKFVNIGGIPIVIGLAAIAVGFWRFRRRRRRYETA
jgi:ABC-type uncharacterized transport system involved in gliding motility auxiliary subunit